jgi:hypothetical protein
VSPITEKTSEEQAKLSQLDSSKPLNVRDKQREELGSALRFVYDEIPKLDDISNLSLDQIIKLEGRCTSEIKALINEYLHQKRRKIKKTHSMKNGFLKVTALFKEKFHNIIESKNIQHLDTLIEEYIGINEINNWLLFSHERFEEEK